MSVWKWIKLKYGEGDSSRWIRVVDEDAVEEQPQVEQPNGEEPEEE